MRGSNRRSDDRLADFFAWTGGLSKSDMASGESYYLGGTAKTISSNTRRQQEGVYSPPNQEGNDDPFVNH